MPRGNKNEDGKIVGVFLSDDMIKRLRFESARTAQTLRSIVTAALDKRLPKTIKIIVGKEAERAAARAEAE